MNTEVDVDRDIRGERKTRGRYRWIARLADRQHRIVTRRQLLDGGLSGDQIDRLIAAGWLHVIHRGVYAVGHAELSDAGRRFAAVAAMGEEGVLIGRAACTHWQLLPPEAGPIDVAVPTQRRPQPVIRPREVKLARRDWRTHGRIRVTTPERTLLDLAATHPHLLDRAIREAHYLKLVSPRSSGEICHRHRGHRGARRLASAVRTADLDKGPTKEELERRFRRFMKTHGLPVPLFNHRLRLGGRTLTPDCLWPDHRLVVELDGHAAHGNPRRSRKTVPATARSSGPATASSASPGASCTRNPKPS